MLNCFSEYTESLYSHSRNYTMGQKEIDSIQRAKLGEALRVRDKKEVSKLVAYFNPKLAQVLFFINNADEGSGCFDKEMGNAVHELFVGDLVMTEAHFFIQTSVHKNFFPDMSTILALNSPEFACYVLDALHCYSLTHVISMTRMTGILQFARSNPISQETIFRSLSHQDSDGMTPLHLACSKDQRSSVPEEIQLLKHIDIRLCLALITKKDRSGQTILHKSAKVLCILKYILVELTQTKYWHEILSIQDNNGQTLLHVGGILCLEILSELRIIHTMPVLYPLLLKTDKNGNTVLHFALSQGHNDLVPVVKSVYSAESLVKAFMIKNVDGFSPMQGAIGKSQMEYQPHNIAMFVEELPVQTRMEVLSQSVSRLLQHLAKSKSDISIK